MQYRIIGENLWSTGTIENMSQTGILFHGERTLEVDSPIEVAVDVAKNLVDKLSSKMVSRGKVVRVSLNDTDPGITLMAAALSRLRILRD
jgi:hypothetical protein